MRNRLDPQSRPFRACLESPMRVHWLGKWMDARTQIRGIFRNMLRIKDAADSRLPPVGRKKGQPGNSNGSDPPTRPSQKCPTAHLFDFRLLCFGRSQNWGRGFEPRQTDSESAVLPLHHPPRDCCIVNNSGRSNAAPLLNHVLAPPMAIRVKSLRVMSARPATQLMHCIRHQRPTMA